MPSRTATSLNPSAPTLRTVVKPASSVKRAFFTPVTVVRGTDTPSPLYPKFSGSLVRWVCTSISPARQVACDRSTAVMPSGNVVEESAATEVMIPMASNTTTWSLRTRPARTSISFPQRTAPGAACAVDAENIAAKAANINLTYVFIAVASPGGILGILLWETDRTQEAWRVYLGRATDGETLMSLASQMSSQFANRIYHGIALIAWSDNR